MLAKEAMNTARTQYTNEEIGQLAEQIYRRSIRDKVMPQHKGKFLILDIESGDYEVDEDDLRAYHVLRARRPIGVFFAFRIGYRSVEQFGAGSDEDDRSEERRVGKECRSRLERY